VFRSGPGVVPHIFPIRIANGRRDAVRDALLAQGIETGMHYKPNHQLTLFRSGRPLPVTESLYAEMLTLPLHPALTVDDVDYVCASLCEAVRTSGGR
jgi:dTDP-4-amino-4,6-dideoxygalactose transaminase